MDNLVINFELFARVIKKNVMFVGEVEIVAVNYIFKCL